MRKNESEREKMSEKANNITHTHTHAENEINAKNSNKINPFIKCRTFVHELF